MFRPELLDESSRYQWHWADRNDFGEIRVTPKMMIDHYPDNVYKALVDVASASSDVPFYSVI